MTEEAFAELFGAHYPAVLAYGLRRVDPDTARDCAAETFLVAWRRLHAEPEDPRSWLLAVARRVLANELRRQARAGRLTERMAQDAVAGGRAVQSAHEDADAGGASGRVAAALARLSADDRELLLLIGWEQLDHAAAARVLGCSRTALKVRLHRARRRLAAHLEATSDPDAPGVPAGARPLSLATEDSP